MLHTNHPARGKQDRIADMKILRVRIPRFPKTGEKKKKKEKRSLKPFA
jgi:hypothetical protein